MTKTHPEDLKLALEISTAREFSAFYRNGPHEKLVERGFETYEAARERADEMEREHSRFGRKAMVYAITKLGSFPCDARMIGLAREIERVVR